MSPFILLSRTFSLHKYFLLVYLQFSPIQRWIMRKQKVNNTHSLQGLSVVRAHIYPELSTCQVLKGNSCSHGERWEQAIRSNHFSQIRKWRHREVQDLAASAQPERSRARFEPRWFDLHAHSNWAFTWELPSSYHMLYCTFYGNVACGASAFCPPDFHTSSSLLV